MSLIFGDMSAIEAAPLIRGPTGWRAVKVIKFHPETTRPKPGAALDHGNVAQAYRNAKRSWAPRPPANPAPAGRVQIGFEVRSRH
jgi:hypothetical protein